MTEEKEGSLRGFAARYVAGAMAGAVEACCTAPLETLKTRQQLSTSRSTISVTAAASGIYSTAGIRGFYFGLPALLLQAAGKVAIRFSAFGFYTNLLSTGDGGRSRVILAGALAGVTEAALWITPCERLKTLRVGEIGVPAAQQTHRSLFSSLSHLARGGGLFRGLSATALRNGSAVGVRFTVYPEAKAAVARLDPEGLLPHSFLAGFAVGALTTVLTQPVDVVGLGVWGTRRVNTTGSSSCRLSSSSLLVSPRLSLSPLLVSLSPLSPSPT